MDYLKKYEKENTRRLSGNHKINGDPKNQPSNNHSPKSKNEVGNVNNFMKSPNMPPNSSKFAEQLNNSIGANVNATITTYYRLQYYTMRGHRFTLKCLHN